MIHAYLVCRSVDSGSGCLFVLMNSRLYSIKSPLHIFIEHWYKMGYVEGKVTNKGTPAMESMIISYLNILDTSRLKIIKCCHLGRLFIIYAACEKILWVCDIPVQVVCSYFYEFWKNRIYMKVSSSKYYNELDIYFGHFAYFCAFEFLRNAKMFAFYLWMLVIEYNSAPW